MVILWIVTSHLTEARRPQCPFPFHPQLWFLSVFIFVLDCHDCLIISVAMMFTTPYPNAFDPKPLLRCCRGKPAMKDFGLVLSFVFWVWSWAIFFMYHNAGGWTWWRFQLMFQVCQTVLIFIKRQLNHRNRKHFIQFRLTSISFRSHFRYNIFVLLELKVEVTSFCESISRFRWLAYASHAKGIYLSE